MNNDIGNAASRGATSTPGTLRQLPVTYSILDAQSLAALVERVYAIGPPLSCELLLPSMNDTYLVTSADRRYILRVYRASWRTADDIGYELDLLIYLAARGVRVSVPIAAQDGRLFQSLLAPEGTRYIALFTYAEGQPLSWDNADHCRQAGQLLAAIHAVSDDFVNLGTRAALGGGQVIDRPVAALEPFFAHRMHDWTYVTAFSAQLRDRLADVAADLNWGVCHGDFGGGNVSVDDTGATAFDFDLCGPSWRAFDLAPIQMIAMSKKNSAIWDAFVRGYQERRSLAPADLTAATLFCPVHRLWRLGLQAEHAQEWGVVRLGDAALDRELKAFRAWEAENGAR
jgi:Ser/Thr protein kinase RdoA (MazF antagonist)